MIPECNGLCGEFTLDNTGIDFEPFVGVGFGIAGDEEVGYDVPAVTLSDTDTPALKWFKWSKFKQGNWYDDKEKISGVEAAKKLGRIKFQWQDVNGTAGKFNIFGLGKYNR